VKVVGAVVDCKAVLFAVNGELAFAYAVAVVLTFKRTGIKTPNQQSSALDRNAVLVHIGDTG
jgi:hypothetical protein